MKRKPIAKHDAYSRVTITIPTFAIIMVRQLVKRANEKRPGSLTVSALLESWLLPTFDADEITELGKQSPEFKRAAESWIRWEAQERRKKRPNLNAGR